MEAFEHILEAWSSILQDVQYYPEQIIKESSVQIFNQFLKTHLSPPDGTRPVVSWIIYFCICKFVS